MAAMGRDGRLYRGDPGDYVLEFLHDRRPWQPVRPWAGSGEHWAWILPVVPIVLLGESKREVVYA